MTTIDIKKFLAALLVITTTSSVYAQEGIGTNNPDNSAVLELSSTTKGFLKPRMTTVQRTAITSPATGLEVYDTTTASTWYFDGIVWVEESSNDWHTNGNTGTTGANFLGTTDNQPLRIRTNGLEKIRITTNGQLTFINTDNNVAIGSGSTLGNYSGVCANNVAIGNRALMNTSGAGSSFNVAVGYQSMEMNITGAYNTAVGQYSLANQTTGEYNTAIGRFTSAGNNFSSTIAIGHLADPTASNTARIGNFQLTSIGGFVNWTNVSDARFKVNVKENISGLDFILKLRPVSYNLDMDAIANWYNTPDSLRMRHAEQLKAAEIQTGFIAQEVEKAAQDLGFAFHGVDAPTNKESHYGLRYAEFVVPLVKATQEQQVIIEQQNEELELLKAQNASMQKQLDEIKKMLQSTIVK